MNVLFQKLTRRNHLLDAYQQTLDKFVLEDGSRLHRFVPGIDGLDFREFQNKLEENLEDCRQFLLKGDREFLPQLQRLVPKDSSGKNWREIYLSSLRDRIIQKAIAMVLWPSIEARLSPHLYSYRMNPKLHQGTAVKRMRSYLTRHGLNVWVFRSDVSNYTESIPHESFRAMLSAWFPKEPKLRQLIGTWLAQKRYFKGGLAPSAVGLPTGSPLTPLFANLYLSDLDHAMDAPQVFYLRFGDDLLAMAEDQGRLREAAARIYEILETKGLRVSEEKTVLQQAKHPFSYLGYNIDGGKIRVGEKALRRYKNWVVKALARGRYRKIPNGTEAERKRLLRHILEDFQTQQSHADQVLAWIKSFPYLDEDRDLRELDRYVKERIRGCVTRESSRKNQRKVPEAWFRELHYRSFVGAYYRVQRRRDLGPYRDWEKYFNEVPEKQTGLSGFKPILRLRNWLQWVRRALDSGPGSGSTPID